MRNIFLISALILFGSLTACGKSRSIPISPSKPKNPVAVPAPSAPAKKDTHPNDNYFKDCSLVFSNLAISSERKLPSNQHESFKLKVRVNQNGSYKLFLEVINQISPSPSSPTETQSLVYVIEDRWFWAKNRIMFQDEGSLSAYLTKLSGPTPYHSKLILSNQRLLKMGLPKTVSLDAINCPIR